MAHENQVEYNRKWRARNANQFKRQQLGYHYLRKYGITQEDYDAIFVEQEGKCKACGVHQLKIKGRLCVDHDHETGEVRALLCSNCNTALGLLKEDITAILKLAEYTKQIKGEKI